MHHSHTVDIISNIGSILQMIRKKHAMANGNAFMQLCDICQPALYIHVYLCLYKQFYQKQLNWNKASRIVSVSFTAYTCMYVSFT